MNIGEVIKICTQLYPNKCDECPFDKDCKDMDEKGIEHILPKDWKE